MKVKWYTVLVLLGGVILSFADPITDILTLVEFYRADHKTWFGVGLAFVILPCLFFLTLNCMVTCKRNEHNTDAGYCVRSLLCGFHPFSVALSRLEGFLFYLKQLMRGDEIDSVAEAKNDMDLNIFYHVFFESALEAAPQFVIQLYAVNVQEEPVTVVQIISLPVSFLSLAWAFTAVDVKMHKGGNARKVKYKLALFLTQVLLLSSRLFAISYFTVSYKWWVLSVLFLHVFVLVITESICICQRGLCHSRVPFLLIFFHCVDWLIDDVAGLILNTHVESKKELRRMQLFSNVLFVLENVVMILLYYFSQHSNNWYSLPVTICVCVVSVLAAVARVTLCHFLRKDDETVNSQSNNNNNNSPTDECKQWISTV